MRKLVLSTMLVCGLASVHASAQATTYLSYRHGGIAPFTGGVLQFFLPVIPDVGAGKLGQAQLALDGTLGVYNVLGCRYSYGCSGSYSGTMSNLFGLQVRSGNSFPQYSDIHSTAVAGNSQTGFGTAWQFNNYIVGEININAGSYFSVESNAYGIAQGDNIASLNQPYAEWGITSYTYVAALSVLIDYEILQDLSDTELAAARRAGFFLSSDATAVPEPSVWAMLLTGFGMAAAGIRRRRINVAFA